MAEGKTITIIQKGRAIEKVTITLKFRAWFALKTSFTVIPIVDGSDTFPRIYYTTYSTAYEPVPFNVPKGSRVKLTGTAIIYNTQGEYDQTANALFEGEETYEFNANSDSEIFVWADGTEK